MSTQESLFRLKRLARYTGVLYLLVIICAGFSQGYVRATLIVPGDALTSASNIAANETLFRIGFVADLIAFLLDACISVMFYELLKPAGKTLAFTAAVFRLLAHPAIASLNLLNHYMALEVMSGAEFLGSYSEAQLHSLSLLFMEAHRTGYLIAGAFFGIHCFLLGVLIYKSRMIPRIFGIMMVVAAIGYLMESFGDFLFPGNEEWLAWVVGIAAALGEVELTLYLLIKGIRKAYLMENGT